MSADISPSLLKALITRADAHEAQNQIIPEASVEVLSQEVQIKIAAALERSHQDLARLQAQIISHDAQNAARYSVRTEYGEITLTQLNPQEDRPPLDTRLTLTLGTQHLTLRSGETPVQIAALDAALSYDFIATLTPYQNQALQTLEPTLQAQLLTSQTQFISVQHSDHAITSHGFIIPPLSGLSLADLSIGQAQDNALNLPAALRTRTVNSFALFGANHESITLTSSQASQQKAQKAALTPLSNGLIDLTSALNQPRHNNKLIGASLFISAQKSPSSVVLGQNTLLHTIAQQNMPAYEAQAHLIAHTQGGEGVLKVNASQLDQNTFLSAYNGSFLGERSENDLFLLPREHAQKLSVGSHLTLRQLEAQHNEANKDAASLAAVAQSTSGLWGMLLQNAQPWPAMQELYQALQTANPHSAAQMASTMPNASAPQSMMLAALFFISAMRSGDMQSWIGDKAIELLEKAGKSKSLGRALQEGQALSRLYAADPSGTSEWRSYALPFYSEGQIHKVLLHTRTSEQENNQTSEKNGQTRFVFDLALPHIGDVQLDGLYDSKQNKLDLLMRTQENFSKAMQAIMQQKFIAALESSGLNGQLRFQARDVSWVRINRQAEQNISLKS